ncbi:RNA polymerase sigma factor [Nannocystis radixulma]|uniref:Sigma-70 family RNA polymerase sigma factor n=1 Tax=Nannocystis radixulma TaxID=2995305 RepID=A0ABT5B5Y4_9BACT|nr:sigma-70 family RNA polymerase sigma factor [Nannocystis radixulma]MDC0668512.1 sigma-70 family RNA polymerase sigma factor [Nannocystis radixulma]
MTEGPVVRTQGDVMADALRSGTRADPESPARSQATAAPALQIDDVFRAHHDFVWRSARRLGCPPGNVDDAVQEVFLVAARRLHELERAEAVRSWLFSVVVHVVRNHRRSHRRRESRHAAVVDLRPDCAPDPSSRYEAASELLELLEVLDDDRRAVFVLASFEQMTAPEIAAALGVKLNTVYSRLRSARELLERAVAARRRDV